MIAITFKNIKSFIDQQNNATYSLIYVVFMFIKVTTVLFSNAINAFQIWEKVYSLPLTLFSLYFQAFGEHSLHLCQSSKPKLELYDISALEHWCIHVF